MTSAACLQCAQSVALADEEMCRPCTQCQALTFRSTSGPLVCVAYENADLRKAIGEALWAAGFNVAATTGAHALQVVGQHAPAAIALDVGLNGTSSHELIQFVKEQATLSNTKIVLVASVYNKSAYKRRPTKLYGADDYVDQHQFEQLPRKIAALLQLSPGALGAGKNSKTTGEGLPARLRIRALSLSIVADIALYHNTEVELAVRTGSLDNLRGALDEGRRLLAEMAHLDLADPQDPIGTAFMAFIDEMRRGDP